MMQYVRCLKADGKVVGDTFEARPNGMPHTILFWVEVQPDAEGRLVFPAPYSQEDELRFVLNMALSDEEMTATNLIKQSSEGSWQHSQTEKDARQSRLKFSQALIDNETRQMIQDWCQAQDEGCEQAFLSKGIVNSSDSRFQAYLTAKQDIIKQQAAKKKKLKV